MVPPKDHSRGVTARHKRTAMTNLVMAVVAVTVMMAMDDVVILLVLVSR